MKNIRPILLALASVLLPCCGGGGGGGGGGDTPPPPPPTGIPTILASLDSAEAQALGGDSYAGGGSLDGQYVVFDSFATNLVANDTNALRDVFVRDTVNGTTMRVSVDSAGVQAVGGDSYGAKITADGRYIVFTSSATNLVVGDANGQSDIFVRDTQLNTTTRVSVTNAGAEATGGYSSSPSISNSGAYVCFDSTATNLVAGDANGVQDVFVRNTLANTTMRVSVTNAGAESTGGVNQASRMSSNGQYVVWESAATNLVVGDINGQIDIFVRDTVGLTTIRASLTNLGAEATGGASRTGSISTDGRYVCFESLATNLVVGDTNAQNDIFVRDTLLNTTTRVSVDSAGAQATGGQSTTATISADGRYVAFSADAVNLVAGDTNGQYDAFVHDIVTGTTIRVSVATGDVQSTGGNSFVRWISMDGKYVSFDSEATNLVTGDVNARGDVFLRGPLY